MILPFVFKHKIKPDNGTEKKVQQLCFGSVWHSWFIQRDKLSMWYAAHIGADLDAVCRGWVIVLTSLIVAFPAELWTQVLTVVR